MDRHQAFFFFLFLALGLGRRSVNEPLNQPWHCHIQVTMNPDETH